MYEQCIRTVLLILNDYSTAVDSSMIPGAYEVFGSSGDRFCRKYMNEFDQKMVDRVCISSKYTLQ